ncbi:MAG: 16S rRNA (adenine(1518)-N(6)/adenine(1519)-N(6))-dimethyltransferase RsmA [Patescibacteria group bacterium]
MSERLGQNFLIDKNIIKKIILAGEVTSSDIIVEIGPGKGILTGALVSTGAYVIAVEKDEKLFNDLSIKYKNTQNLELILGDIRSFDFDHHVSLLGKKYKIIANIPYYLTSFLIRQLMALSHKPDDIVLMIQKEVGERMVAGSGDMNLLALSVQLFAQVKVLFGVSKVAFSPAPRVDSVVVSIIPKPVSILDSNDIEDFFIITRSVFQNKRKMIANPLAQVLDIEKTSVYDILKSISIDPDIRPQELSVEQWVELFYATKKIQK